MMIYFCVFFRVLHFQLWHWAHWYVLCSPSVVVGKEPACKAGDLGLLPGLGRSPGEGKGYPLQYSGLENSMDCIVHGVTTEQFSLSLSFSVVWVKGPTSFFCMRYPGCSSTVCLEHYLFHIEWFWYTCQKINLSRTYGTISELLIIFCSSIYLST